MIKLSALSISSSLPTRSQRKGFPLRCIFINFDMDAVRTADAPGVSATYPVGLTADEICQIVRIAGEDERTRIVEITEVNPRYDQDHRTCKLAAMMIMYYLSSLAVQLYR